MAEMRSYRVKVMFNLANLIVMCFTIAVTPLQTLKVFWFVLCVNIFRTSALKTGTKSDVVKNKVIEVQGTNYCVWVYSGLENAIRRIHTMPEIRKQIPEKVQRVSKQLATGLVTIKAILNQ